jgi:type III pantothenate kinase
MLLTIDIGNSNIVLGIYPLPAGEGWPGDAPAVSWRLTTDRARTADEYRLLLCQLLADKGVAPSQIRGAALCSVVAPLGQIWQRVLTDLIGQPPLLIRHSLNLGITLGVKRPESLGTDRIVDGVAGYTRAGGAAIVIDFGTATTFNVINQSGHFLGGAIAPGLGTITAALVERASALPGVELLPPPTAIGPDTIPAIQSGLVYGYVGLVEGLIARIRAEMGEPVTVLATGGLGGLIAPLTPTIDAYDPWLTLAGIGMIYARNVGRET